MADVTLQSFVIKIRHEIDPASQKRFSDSLHAGLAQIKAMHLALAALAYAAVESLTKTVDSLNKLNTVSRVTGVTVAQLKEARAAFKAMELGAEEADAAIVGLEKRMRDPGMVEVYEQLIKKPFTNAKDAIFELGKEYHRIVEANRHLGGERSEAALTYKWEIEKFNVDFEKVIRRQDIFWKEMHEGAKRNREILLRFYGDRQGGTEEEQYKRAEKRQQEAAERAKKVDEAWTGVSEAFNTLIESFVSENFDAIIEILHAVRDALASKELREGLTDLVNLIREFMAHQFSIKGITDTIREFGRAVLEVAGWIGAAKQYLDNLSKLGTKEYEAPKELQGNRLGENPFKGESWLWNKLFGKSEEKKGGYQHGGIVPINAHAGEMVLPSDISSGLIGMIRSGRGPQYTSGLETEMKEWFAGDSSFRPLVAFAGSVYTELEAMFRNIFGDKLPGGGEGSSGSSGGGGAGGGGAGGGGGEEGGGAGGGAGGGGEGGGDKATSLAEDRKKFAEELANNPELRDKVMRIAANEQGQSGRGTQQVIESMMNRASIRGRTLAQEAKWTGEKGYYAQGTMGRGALENAAHREILERSLKAALEGGNLANYATDNASQGLAVRGEQTGRFKVAAQSIVGAQTGQRGNETFFTPGTANPGDIKRFAEWRARMGPGGGAPAGAPAGMQDTLAGLNALTQEAERAGLTVTSGYRDPHHHLSRANPRSQHITGRAFDVRARTAAQADEAMKKIRTMMAGRGLEYGRDYTMIDEVRRPFGHTTAPHVHTQLTPQGMQRYREAMQQSKGTQTARSGGTINAPHTTNVTVNGAGDPKAVAREVSNIQQANSARHTHRMRGAQRKIG